MNNSDDEQFEDTYDSIAAEEEEAIEPLEVKGAAIIQSTMPGGDENKPPKSIFKAMTTHLSLLKDRDGFLDTDYDEVCRRSARGLPEVCRRSAGGLPEVGRKCAKFESTEDHQQLLPTQEEK